MGDAAAHEDFPGGSTVLVAPAGTARAVRRISFLQAVAQGVDADAEKTSGLRLIASGSEKRSLHGSSLQLGQIQGRERAAAVSCGFDCSCTSASLFG